MFENEIEGCLSNYYDFLGVFPRDQIPNIRRYPSFLILNTDKASELGTHWVAMLFKENQCEYFDSFGLPPLHSEVISAVEHRKLLWNGRCLQHPASKTCGEFCVAFVKMRSQKISFTKFVSSFSKDTKCNDRIVKSICYSKFLVT